MVHGKSSTRLYGIWSGMKDRCYNTKGKNYYSYGARGITICEEWKRDFMAFHDWAIKTGYDETAPRGQYTIDRIDNDGPYCPDNCRWVTIKEQERNKRTNIKVTVGDRTMALSEACESLGLKYTNERNTIRRRASGVRPMSEYNEERKKVVEYRAEELRAVIKDHPDWTNAQLAKEFGLSVRSIQNLKKLVER